MQAGLLLANGQISCHVLLKLTLDVAQGIRRRKPDEDASSKTATQNDLLFIRVDKPGENNSNTKRLIRSQAMLEHSRKQREKRQSLGLNFIPYQGSRKKAQGKATKRVERGPSLFLKAQLDPFAALPELPRLPQDDSSFNELKMLATRWYAQPIMHSFILPLTVSHPAMFMGLIFQTSASLDAMRGQGESRMSTLLKTETVRLINQNLSHPQKALAAENIAAIAMVGAATNTYSAGDYTEYRMHRTGMDKLIDLRGGIPSFMVGKSSFDQVFSKLLILHFFMTTERSGGTIPLREVFESLLDVEKPDVFDKPMSYPESPYYSPSNFENFRSPASRAPRRLALLRDIRDLFQTLEKEYAFFFPNKDEITAERAIIRERILNLPHVDHLTPGRKTPDFIFESCRLAALIMIRMIDFSQPARDAVNGTNLCAQLKAALMKTDLERLWGELVGVLWWIILLAVPAAHGSPEWPFFSALSTRLMFEMGYQNFCYKSCFAPIAKSIWLQKLCAAGPEAAVTYRENAFIDLGSPERELGRVIEEVAESSPESIVSASSTSTHTAISSSDERFIEEKLPYRRPSQTPTKRVSIDV
ncbi:MAG: hypothetical protein M1834_001967 [Cirrosporium novae-zelandiae]|nr:MAG: hypothetical protein M1834_001967 [Cirrosporium novae-zelandiae]